MTKESIYELQKLDCNCNDCGYLVRDIQAYRDNLSLDKSNQQLFFDWRKERAINAALFKKEQGKKNWEIALKDAQDLKHVFFPQKVAQCYGKCTNFDKVVTFLPGTCQLDTQACFVHRKDILE